MAGDLSEFHDPESGAYTFIFFLVFDHVHRMIFLNHVHRFLGMAHFFRHALIGKKHMTQELVDQQPSAAELFPHKLVLPEPV